MFVCDRNNLTALDMLVVQGRGAYGQLQFGSQRPGSSSPLLFELVEKHLKDCECTGDGGWVGCASSRGYQEKLGCWGGVG